MTKDGGGNWNRAARKSGGYSRTPIVRCPTASFNEWMESVRRYIGSPEKFVTMDQLVTWYENGERSSWVAAQVIQKAKAT